MSYQHCPTCAGLLYPNEVACRICRAPVAGASPPAPARPLPGGWDAPPPNTWFGDPPAPPVAAAPPPPPPPPPAPPGPPATGPSWALPSVPPIDAAPAPASASPGPDAPPAPSSAAPAPYAPAPYGPPGYAPPAYGPPGYAPPGYGPSGYAPPAYGPPGAPGPAWPPPPGATPPGYAPPPWGPTPPRPPKQVRTGVVVVASLLTVCLVGALCIGAVTLLGKKTSSYPETWDPRVQFAVDFVEQEKGTSFKHPVYVDFVPDTAFKDEVGSQQDVSQDERDAAADQAAMLRALGLVRGEVNLIDEQSNLQSSGTAAYYDPVAKRIKVRGTSIDLDLKATIVHELTHAWQDQHTDLGRLDRMDLQEGEAFRAVVEGDAENVEHDWVASLPESEQDAFGEQSMAKSDEAEQAMSSVPAVMIASFAAPYELGPSFMQAMEADGGQERVEEVLLDPPKNDRDLVLPWLYLDDRGTYTEPDLPGAIAEDDPALIDDGSFGSLFTYLLLAEQIDPQTAMAATDVLSGDAYQATKKDGKVCVTARFTSEPGQDGPLVAAFAAWAAAVPTATVTPSADVVAVETCDPGTSTSSPAPAADEPGSGRSLTVLALPVLRVVVWSQALDSGLTPVQAECIAKAAGTQLTMADLQNPSLSGGRGEEIGLAAGTACR